MESFEARGFSRIVLMTVSRTIRGGVISPILYALMMSDLPSHLTIGNAVFADGAAIWNAGRDL